MLMCAFMLQLFGTQMDLKGSLIDLDAVENELIQPVFNQGELVGTMTVEITKAGNIRDDMPVSRRL